MALQLASRIVFELRKIVGDQHLRSDDAALEIYGVDALGKGHPPDVVVIPAGVYHGFSEVLYAFSSASNNNGSAFAGLNANTPFYNTSLGLAFLFGRYWLAVPVLALAGSLARKKLVPPGLGTLATHTPLFVVLLVGTVILVGALTYVPALALGPIAEHLTLVMAK